MQRTWNGALYKRCKASRNKTLKKTQSPQAGPLIKRIPQHTLAREQSLGLLNIFPDEVLIYIRKFLAPYERLCLGTVSKEFRALFLGDYDKFTNDTWNMGKTPGLILQSRKGVLEDLASRAYGEIVRRVPTALKKQPNEGVCCSALVKLSTSHQTPTGEAVIKVNCLGELIADGKTIRALNFIGYSDQESAQSLAKSLDVNLEAFNYSLITHHHVELRFLLKLAHGMGAHGATLNIDKLCCLFCSIQLLALGYSNLISGWHAHNLSWYTFSPLVMYFRDSRQQVWGHALDGEFFQLNSNEKLYVLNCIVGLTQNVEQTLSLIPEPYALPKCRVPGCNGYLEKSSLMGKWACSAWKNTRCSGEPDCPKCKKGGLRLTEPSGKHWRCYYCQWDAVWSDGPSKKVPSQEKGPAKITAPPKPITTVSNTPVPGPPSFRLPTGATTPAPYPPLPYPPAPRQSPLGLTPTLSAPTLALPVHPFPGQSTALSIPKMSHPPPSSSNVNMQNKKPRLAAIAPSCPKCGAEMSMRGAAVRFWGCSRYFETGCRGMRDA